MNDEILTRLRTLSSDVERSPEYSADATRRAKGVVDSVYSELLKLHNRTMQGFSGGMGVNKMMGARSTPGSVLGNMMGGMAGSPFTKDRLTIGRDIDVIKRKVGVTREVTPQLKTFVNQKLDMIKGMR